MIFGAGFVDNINTAVAIFLWGGLIAGVVCFVVGNASKGELSAAYKSASRQLLTYAMIALLPGILVPSAQTIYLIAASQAGEVIIKNPEMQEVFNDLKMVIKSKLAEQLPKPR